MIHVVLYEPEIPANTGNIIRTCMATGCRLHLIEPLGFYMDEKHLRRSGMDYIQKSDYEIHKNWQDFTAKYPSRNYYFMTRYGNKAPSDYNFAEIDDDIFLVLGKESTGVDKYILNAYHDHCMRLPMVPDARSLNLSNCAAVVVYEVLRQKGYPNLAAEEVLKGADYLDQFEPSSIPSI